MSSHSPSKYGQSVEPHPQSEVAEDIADERSLNALTCATMNAPRGHTLMSSTGAGSDGSGHLPTPPNAPNPSNATTPRPRNGGGDDPTKNDQKKDKSDKEKKKRNLDK